MKRDREDDNHCQWEKAIIIAPDHEDESDTHEVDLNGIRKKFKVPDSSRGGVLSNLGDYGEEEDEEEMKEKVYEYESDEEAEPKSAGVRRDIEMRRDCPYLDTVNRQVLDFDFEKFCSVSLSNLNVYACLVCGKYFQGRGRKSYAYTHSLEAGHHVFINLQTEKVYCLPDGYEVNDSSLDDIRYVLNPRFTRAQAEQLDKIKQWSRALDGSDYLPGMVGINNIKENDFVNVTIQSLMRVTPLRNFFLLSENYKSCKSPLVQRYGELTKKIWHTKNFKGQVCISDVYGDQLPFRFHLHKLLGLHRVFIILLILDVIQFRS
jgi:U4/U6.U5 tri-snRNP-associated protein 2